jgi:delta 1-pyrroline-5-carboxylate dehydrogenase
MSGTDSKAGGREYLLQFMQGKLVSEKIGAAAKSESKEVLNAGDTSAKAF